MSFGKLFVPASKHDSQGFGSALSYAKRYSIQTALCIASADDDGESAVKSAPPKVEKPKGIDMDATVDQMAAAVSYESLKDIFRLAWTQCLKEQQPVLKAMYDGIKANWEQT
jgi:hypothetical protein